MKHIMDNRNICELCGTEKELVPAGSNKFKSWDAFMGCPNYKKHPKAQKGGYDNPKQQNKDVILLDEINALNRRLDNFAEFMAKLDKFIRSKFN